MPRRKSVDTALTSSTERYRELLWTLTQKAVAGPDHDKWPGDPRLAFAEYRVSLELLSAVAKAATSDKQLEDLSAIQKRLREAEDLVAEMMKASASERHNSATRLTVGRALGAGVTREPIH